MGESSPTTFVAGTLPYEVKNPNGDWTSWVVKGELQFSPKADWMDCVSRALTNVVEVQEKQQTGMESNYCDREVALGSETTRQGNYIDKVCEYARTTGLGQQDTYPDSKGDWEEQYQVIPSDTQMALMAEKVKWLSKWEIKYESVSFDKKSLQYHLKHAPLIVVIPGHAMCGIFSNKDIEKVLDSYEPFLKNIPSEYYPGSVIYAMKIVLYKKEQALDPDMLFINLKFGDKGNQVLKLRRALTRLGWFSADGDIYDNNLARTVWTYSLANLPRYGWSWWWAVWYQGKRVGLDTRESINKNLTKRK